MAIFMCKGVEMILDDVIRCYMILHDFEHILLSLGGSENLIGIKDKCVKKMVVYEKP